MVFRLVSKRNTILSLFDSLFLTRISVATFACGSLIQFSALLLTMIFENLKINVQPISLWILIFFIAPTNTSFHSLSVTPYILEAFIFCLGWNDFKYIWTVQNDYHSNVYISQWLMKQTKGKHIWIIETACKVMQISSGYEIDKRHKCKYKRNG